MWLCTVNDVCLKWRYTASKAGTKYLFKYMPWLSCCGPTKPHWFAVDRFGLCDSTIGKDNASSCCCVRLHWRLLVLMKAECCCAAVLGPFKVMLTCVTFPPLLLTWLPEKLLMWGSTLLRKVWGGLCLCLCSWNIREFRGIHILYEGIKSFTVC